MKTITRKAVLTKNVKLTPKKFSPNTALKSLPKGTEVLIKEEGYLKGRMDYSLTIADSADTTEYKVTRSQFEFSEKAKFSVNVTRISYACRTIEVEAIDEKDAERLALEAAGDFDFSEHDAEYKTDGAMLKQ